MMAYPEEARVASNGRYALCDAVATVLTCPCAAYLRLPFCARTPNDCAGGGYSLMHAATEGRVVKHDEAVVPVMGTDAYLCSLQ